MTTLAETIWDGVEALSRLEDNLDDAGIKYASIGHDPYDSSLEINGVADHFRLTGEQQQMLRQAGFARVYVNHKNKWETHYNWRGMPFPVGGWRVSYPHKRGDEFGAILVEEFVYTWPQKWFDTGKVKIVDRE
jgi:hypothetical protein